MQTKSEHNAAQANIEMAENTAQSRTMDSDCAPELVSDGFPSGDNNVAEEGERKRKKKQSVQMTVGVHLYSVNALILTGHANRWR